MLLNFLDDFNPVGWGWLPAETQQEIPAGGVSSFLQLHFPPRIAIIVIIIFATTIIITSWASQGTLWYKEILRASFKRHPVYIHLAFINLFLRAWNKKCVIFLVYCFFSIQKSVWHRARIATLQWGASHLNVFPVISLELRPLFRPPPSSPPCFPNSLKLAFLHKLSKFKFPPHKIHPKCISFLVLSACFYPSKKISDWESDVELLPHIFLGVAPNDLGVGL